MSYLIFPPLTPVLFFKETLVLSGMTKLVSSIEIKNPKVIPSFFNHLTVSQKRFFSFSTATLYKNISNNYFSKENILATQKFLTAISTPGIELQNSLHLHEDVKNFIYTKKEFAPPKALHEGKEIAVFVREFLTPFLFSSLKKSSEFLEWTLHHSINISNWEHTVIFCPTFTSHMDLMTYWSYLEESVSPHKIPFFAKLRDSKWYFFFFLTDKTGKKVLKYLVLVKPHYELLVSHLDNIPLDKYLSASKRKGLIFPHYLIPNNDVFLVSSSGKELLSIQQKCIVKTSKDPSIILNKIVDGSTDFISVFNLPNDRAFLFDSNKILLNEVSLTEKISNKDNIHNFLDENKKSFDLMQNPDFMKNLYTRGIEFHTRQRFLASSPKTHLPFPEGKLKDFKDD